MPLVSVVVPNYNHAEHLPRRLRSVLGQTHGDTEVLLLDDASTDGSLPILRAAAGADRRARVIANDANTGNPFVQWNRGVAAARGEYVWVAESDDDADPRLLERLVAALEANPRCVMAACESWYVTGAGEPTERTNGSQRPDSGRWREDWVADGRAELRDQLVARNTMPNAGAVVFRRDAYGRVGGADESMRLCGDWMTWAKLLAVGDLAHVGEALNYYRCDTAAVRRRHGGSATTQAEVYAIVAFIAGEAGVAPDALERVLAARAARFVSVAWERQFALDEMMTVYRAARGVDRHAWRRIALRWSRWQTSAVARRVAAAATAAVASGWGG